MICKRCGNALSENTSICPSCGTVSDNAKAGAQPPTSYGQFPQSDFREMRAPQTPQTPHASQVPPLDQHSDPRLATPPDAGKSQLQPYSAQQIATGYIPPYYHH